MSRRRLIAAMCLAAVVVFAVATPFAWVRSTYGNHTSGDEPHYLLTTISLAEDGDLDVADETVSGAYRPFHEQTLRPQAAADAEQQVVPHDPLLPALLAVPWTLGGWLAAKLALALFAGALAALVVWTAVRRAGAALGVSLVTAMVTVGTAPVAVYGTQIYPEVPAALMLLGGVAAAWGRRHHGHDAIVMAAVIALPWLAVKFVPVAAALALIHLAGRWRAEARGDVGALVGAYVIAALVYLGLHVRWYGGATAYAAGEFFRDHGGEWSAVGPSPHLAGRSSRLLGLLVDRGFGIAAWQPAWLLAPAAIGNWVTRRTSGWLVPLVPAVVGWLTATFVAHTMHGWWFPGRQIIVILPLLALMVASWASHDTAVGGESVRLRGISLAALGAGGAVTTLQLLRDGLAERVTLVVDFARTSSPVLAVMRTLLPDYHVVSPRTWWLHALWGIAMVTVVVLGARRVTRDRELALAPRPQ